MTAWLAFGFAGLALTVGGVSLGSTVYQLRNHREHGNSDGA
jgi:hypothetical protein